MSSNYTGNKKRVLSNRNETDVESMPGANKKARKEPNNKTIINNRHRDLCTYVESWLNATLHQRHRLRRYSNSQVDNFHIRQEDRAASTAPMSCSPKSLSDSIGSVCDDSLDGAVSNCAMIPVSGSASGKEQPCSAIGSDLSRTSSGSASSSRGQSLVQRNTYRTTNLACNGIQFEHRYTPAPKHLTSLMDRVSQRRDSLEPALQHIQADYELQDVICGAPEAKVARYFAEEIVGKPGRIPPLSNQIGLSIHRRHLPSNTSTTMPDGRISQPRPDLLYGFSKRSFPNHGPQLNAMPILNANSQNLVLPFFAIEFKAQGPSGSGNLWVAENQLMAASTACVRIAQQLNNQLEDCSHTNNQHVQKINTHAFSVAMSGTEARLFITWHDSPERYVMKHMRSYLVSEPHQFLEFRRVVRNIIDWGKDERLGEILNCFDALMTQSRS